MKRTNKGPSLHVKRSNKLTSKEFRRHCAAAGFPLSVMGNNRIAASALGISTRTLERYKSNGCHNKTVINLLMTLVYGVAQSASWQGWRINAQYLITPDGDHIKQSDIQTLWANRKAKAHLERRLAHVEHMMSLYYDKERAHKVANLEKFKAVAKLANDIEELVGHYSQLQRSWVE